MGPATRLEDTQGHQMIPEPRWQLLTLAVPCHRQLCHRLMALPLKPTAPFMLSGGFLHLLTYSRLGSYSVPAPSWALGVNR